MKFHLLFYCLWHGDAKPEADSSIDNANWNCCHQDQGDWFSLPAQPLHNEHKDQPWKNETQVVWQETPNFFMAGISRKLGTMKKSR